MNANESAPAITGTDRGEAGQAHRQNKPTTARKQVTIDPPPEHGVHQWLAVAAWQCRKARMTAQEALALLYAYEGQCRRNYSPGEPEDAVAMAYNATTTRRPGQPRPTRKAKPRKFEWVPATTAELADRHLFGIGDWMQDREPWTKTPMEIITELFRPDDSTLFCVGKSMSDFCTRPFAELHGLDKCQFIVPTPMTAPTGMTKTGKLSEHTLENTGPRRFIVVDLDSPPPREHPAIIYHLARYRDPALVMLSGGKGMHAWFPTGKDDESFWNVAVILGADPVLQRNPSQFVRMPNGRRDNGNFQPVLHLNPNARCHE